MKVSSVLSRKRSPNSLQNLAKGKCFRKGTSGNPGGRPKTAELRVFLLDWLAEKPNGVTRQRQLVEQIAKTKPEIILHYAYGKPVDELSISHHAETVSDWGHKSVEELRAELERMGALDSEGNLIEDK